MRSFNALVHPDDRDVLQRNMLRFQESEENIETECRVKHADGRWIWVQLRAEIQRDQDGNPVRSVGFVIDITDRKTAALELEKNKEKLELVLEASQAGYFDNNWVNGVVDWSPQTYDILGFSRSFVPDSKTFNSLIHPEERKVFATAIENLRNDGTPVNEEVRVRHANGQYIWVQIRANRHVNEFGQLDRAIGFIVDISDRKHIEEALKESEERFRVVAENATDLITIRDPNGNVTYASPSAEAITGYSPQELIDSPRGSMTYEEDREKLEQRRKDRDAGETLEPGPVRWRLRRKDGRLIWLETSSTNLPLAEGEPA